MNGSEPFEARVTSRPPRRRDVVAPERDVVTGRYRGEIGRDHKDRRPEPDRPTRPRRPSRVRPRRLRPWHVAAGAGAVAVTAGAIALAAGGGDGAPTAAPATEPPVTVAAPTTESAGEPSATAAASTAVPVADTAALVTARSTPTTAAPISTVVPVDVATELAGDYSFTMTIIDGNPNFPVGTSQEVAVTLAAESAALGCAVSSPQYPGASWSFDGTGFATTVTVAEACLRDPGISVDTTIDVLLNVTGRDPDGLPSALTGTQTQATPGAAACPDTVNDPIAWSIAATRTG